MFKLVYLLHVSHFPGVFFFKEKIENISCQLRKCILTRNAKNHSCKQISRESLAEKAERRQCPLRESFELKSSCFLQGTAMLEMYG